MFSKIFVENDVAHLPRTKAILSHYPHTEVVAIEDLEEIFNKVKKPYLQKRENLQLFLGRKKGKLIKPTPDAYGMTDNPHYYFIHAYNCIYECQYCYLQGYFHSPDIVLFLNYEEIFDQMKQIVSEHPNQEVWFHAGEYSDSLALSHLTQELPLLFETFKSLPSARCELRSKSVNTKELLKIDPLPNVICSFSLSSEENIKTYDLKTPPLRTRLKGLQKLRDHGHTLGLHFDPVVYSDHFEKEYQNLLAQITQTISPEDIEYISLGVVRFTKDVFHQVKKNYPDSPLLQAEFVKSFDNKVRYSRPMRSWMLAKIKDICLSAGFEESQLYFCMENGME